MVPHSTLSIELIQLKKSVSPFYKIQLDVRTLNLSREDAM